MDYASEMWMEGMIVEERARLERYGGAWKAYFGETEKPLVVKKGKPDDNVQVNVAREIVDKTVSFLFGSEPLFELDADAEGETPAEAWLADVWRRNRKMQTLQKIALNGAVCGHAFVKIQLPTPRFPVPRLINLSPEYVSVVCDPDDIDLVHRYLIQYPAVGKDGERLVIRQRVEHVGDGAWDVLDEVSTNGHGWVTRLQMRWPYMWSPVVDCQNLPSPNEYYGIADLEGDVLGLNAALNFTLSNLQRIVRYHAHPKTWGKGFMARELSVAADETIVLPGDQAELHNLEMQGDISSSIELYQRIKEALHEVTRTPEVATGKLESTTALSGTALKILYGPLIEKTETKRLTYGEMLMEVNRRLLDMGGWGEFPNQSIKWQEIAPGNPLEDLQAALLKKQLGVSTDTLIQEAGYNADDESAKRDAETINTGDVLLTQFDQGRAANAK